MINETNIYQKGMLVNLHQGNYAGRKKLSKDQLGDLPQEIVRGVHDLFEKEFKKLLQDISAFDRDTRHLVKYRSVPFPIDGVYFVANDKIENIIDELESRKELRLELIEKAVDNYEAAIETFATAYPDYYRHARGKYLSKGEFQSRFYCKYQFLKISAPDKADALISPELYKKEMAKFAETIAEMKRDVVETIYQELLEATVRLKNQCDNNTINQRTFNTLNEFLVRIDDVYADFVDRGDLIEAIKKIKVQMLGVNAEDLRDSEDSKKQFRENIGAIINEIQALPDVQLKRAIDF